MDTPYDPWEAINPAITVAHRLVQRLVSSRHHALSKLATAETEIAFVATSTNMMFERKDNIIDELPDLPTEAPIAKVTFFHRRDDCLDQRVVVELRPCLDTESPEQRTQWRAFRAQVSYSYLIHNWLPMSATVVISSSLMLTLFAGEMDEELRAHLPLHAD